MVYVGGAVSSHASLALRQISCHTSSASHGQGQQHRHLHRAGQWKERTGHEGGYAAGSWRPGPCIICQHACVFSTNVPWGDRRAECRTSILSPRPHAKELGTTRETYTFGRPWHSASTVCLWMCPTLHLRRPGNTPIAQMAWLGTTRTA